MSHPLVVEAAETLFVPVAVKNNTSGDADARVRERFEEPAWNNPVVRIVDAEEKELAPRLSGDWTVAGLVTQMITALKKSKRDVPSWLRDLAYEETAHRRGVETAIFGMS